MLWGRSKVRGTLALERSAALRIVINGQVVHTGRTTNASFQIVT
jgi:hypothetical protein